MPLQSPSTNAAVSVPMLRTSSGLYKVPVLINGTLTLNFLIDTGASDVSIPLDVFLTLLRAGTIDDLDIIGEREYTLADGSKSTSTAFRIFAP